MRKLNTEEQRIKALIALDDLAQWEHTGKITTYCDEPGSVYEAREALRQIRWGTFRDELPEGQKTPEERGEYPKRGAMATEEALEEAKRRWGFHGVCRDRGDDPHPLMGQYMVGVENPASGSILVHGEGPTWEDAFHEAGGRTDFMNFMADRPTGGNER